MKKMSLRAKRWAIVAIFMVVAVAGWLFLGDFADEWVVISFIAGVMTEWQLIRCPMCDRHMAWTDKEICAICAQEIAENEAREQSKPY